MGTSHLWQEALNIPFLFDPSARCDSSNPFDRWMLAYTQTLVRFVHQEMQGLAVSLSRFSIEKAMSSILSHVLSF